MKKNKKSSFAMICLFVSFIVLSLACASNSVSGDIPDSYIEIVDITGDKDSIYTKANLVFVDLFKHADSVIQYSDKESGVLKGRYITKNAGYVGLMSYDVYTTIEVDVKEGKYRIVMSIAEIKAYGSDGRTYQVPVNDSILKKMNDEWSDLAKDFKTKMLSDSSW